jgi:hypothetical protein
VTDNRAWVAEITATSSAAPPTEPYTEPETAQPDTPADINARPKRALLIFGAAVTVGAAAVIGLTSSLGSHPAPQTVPQNEAVTAAPSAIASPQPTAAVEPLHYIASDHCPPGSTQPQLLTDQTTDSAWICVRGQLGAELDGQIIHIDFGRPQVVTSVEIVAGAAAKTRGGKDEWDKHRVVHMLQYNFCNGDTCIPVSQDTTDGRGGPVPKGPLPKQLEHPVLADTVDVLILQTDRPAPVDTETPAPTAAPDQADPVDYTVAVASLKFFGYPPTGQ